MIENIVRRAKKLSIKRLIAGGEKGITTQDLLDSIHQEFQRARGPAEHHQPRRLGEDLRQEGRAHRLRAHAHRRGQGSRGRPLRSNASPPASTCRQRRSTPGGRADRPGRRAGLRPRAPVVSLRGRPQGVRHRDGVRDRLAGRRRRATRCVASSMLINAYVEHRKVGWDFEDESPGRDARGFARDDALAARDRDPPRQHGAHERRPVLRRPRPPGVLHAGVHRRPRRSCATTRRGSAILARSMQAARRLLPPGQEIVVYKNNSDGKGNSYGMPRELPGRPDGPVLDAGPPPAPVVRDPPDLHRGRQGRLRERCRRGRRLPDLASGPTSSRRRSGSRPRSSARSSTPATSRTPTRRSTGAST